MIAVALFENEFPTIVANDGSSAFLPLPLRSKVRSSTICTPAESNVAPLPEKLTKVFPEIVTVLDSITSMP